LGRAEKQNEFELGFTKRGSAMKAYVLCVLAGFMLVTPSLVAQNNGTAPPAIPEEARRHFVIGATLFKDAKTPDDYAQVESQFKQAVDLAPQWPDARYNLALSKEAAGDYSGAMADLKLYLQFKLPEAEARTAQDKIYVLEAKAEAVTRKQNVVASEEQKKKEYQDKIGFLAGAWVIHRSLFNGPYSSGPGLITITDNNISITFPASGYELIRGTIEGDDYSSIKWVQTPNRNDPHVADLPDCPIQVTIDKYAHTIRWSEAAIDTSTHPWSWNRSAGNDIQLTQ
jgi:tetratricopeptide (TPR) repeat protein